MIGSERVIGGHDGVEDLVPVRVGASDAPLFGVVWENAFLTEDGLDKKTKDAVNGIMLGGWGVRRTRHRRSSPWQKISKVK